MATYKVDIEKLYEGEYWTNVYYVGPDLTSLTEAAQQALIIYNMEREIHKTNVTFTRYRVSTVLPGDFQYLTTAVNSTGLYNISTDVLPLWNVVRVDLTDEGFKRPERKYYRLPLAEGEQSNTVLNTTLANTITTAVNSIVNDPNVNWIGPNTEVIVSASTFPRVGMRQLRRGSKRKTEPVIPE